MTRLTKHILKITTIQLNPIRTVWRYTSNVTINVDSPHLGSCRKLRLGSWVFNPGRLAFINRAIRQDRPFLAPNKIYYHLSMPDNQIWMAMPGPLPKVAVPGNQPGIGWALPRKIGRGHSGVTETRVGTSSGCHNWLERWQQPVWARQ